MTPDISGPTSLTPFAFYDPDSSCWRTSQGTFPWDSMGSRPVCSKCAGTGVSPQLAQWYVSNLASLQDVLRSAELAHENSGQRQFVHRHRHGEPCVSVCREVRHSGGSSDPVGDAGAHDATGVEPGREP